MATPAWLNMKRTDLPAALQARVALMRFGLGARKDLPSTFWTNRDDAYNACIAELDTAGMAKIDRKNPEFSKLLDEDRAIALAAGGSIASRINFGQELRARYAKHLKPKVGFVERLALFWMNYFNMYHSSNNTVLALIGATERNVIRANTLGKFETLLLGISQSAAMLTYLDGRNSTKVNTNQNFAREILELHTLGSNAASLHERQGGIMRANYSQHDVDELAKVLTGWRVRHDAADDPHLVPAQKLAQSNIAARTFTFVPSLHEPGLRKINVDGYGSRGPRSYADAGVDTGIKVLKDLAATRQTARHVAQRMLCHFMSSLPPEPAVDTLADTFMETGGNLKEVARALLNLDVVWTMPLTRLRLPYPWFISMLRAIDLPVGALANIYKADANHATFQDKIDYVGGYLRMLGQQPWFWPTPDGYPDRETFWENGNAIRMRAAVAYDFLKFLQQKNFPAGAGLRRVSALPNTTREAPLVFESVEIAVKPATTYHWKEPSAIDVLARVGGPNCRPELKRQVASLAATDNAAALALLFSSPEFILR